MSRSSLSNLECLPRIMTKGSRYARFEYTVHPPQARSDWQTPRRIRTVGRSHGSSNPIRSRGRAHGAS
ncbi:hypothetical protein VTK26DRAFT_2142 [Humicola hyalothermophila]